MRSASSQLVLRLSVPLCLGLLGCLGRSDDEVQAEFDAFVSKRDGCETDRDCVLIHTECPLGCFHAVNARHAAAVERKARELVDDYERGGQSCAYDCSLAFGAECREATCAVRQTPGDAGAP